MSAVERVRAWREQWVTLRGLDHERIHTANYATLLLSDIDALLAAVDPAAGFWEQATSNHLEAEYPESAPARRHENVRTDLV